MIDYGTETTSLSIFQQSDEAIMRFTTGTAMEIKYLFIALSLQLELHVFYCTVMLDFLVHVAETTRRSLMLHLGSTLEMFLFQLKHITLSDKEG